MYLQKCASVCDLKKEYRRLAMLYHPDRGGDTAIMAAINSEYKRMMEVLERGGDESACHSQEQRQKGKPNPPKRTRKKSYYSGQAIKDFVDRYFVRGGHLFRIDAETCVLYGNFLKTVIIKEVNHDRLGKVYTTRFYNTMPKKYADILGVAV